MKIDINTRFITLIGTPLSQSFAARMQNAAYESAEWSEAYKEGRKMTTSCCPAFINMLRKHFPKQFEDNMSSTVSPMCAISRYLKYLHPGCITVFKTFVQSVYTVFLRSCKYASVLIPKLRSDHSFR